MTTSTLASLPPTGSTIITKNPADFKALHDLDQRHSGILAVYQDNDPSRDMSHADIVRANRNLEEAAPQGGPPIPGQFHTLNDWRYRERWPGRGMSPLRRCASPKLSRRAKVDGYHGKAHQPG